MKDLGKKVASATFWVTIGSLSQQVINFAMFVYLAQALPVKTFGVMALAMVFVEILMVAGKMGQTDWLLHKTELTQQESSTSFWLLALIGGAFSLLLVLLAPAVSWSFDEPEVLGVMIALAPICFLVNLAGVQEARLRRAFKFKGIAMRAMFGSAVSAIAALIGMALDWGVYALVAQKFGVHVGMAAAVILMDRWRPSLYFSLSMAKDLAINGVRTASGIFTHQLAPRVVDGIVAGVLNTTALGYLRIAWQFAYFVLNLLIYPVTNVSTATFGKIKDDPIAMSDTLRSMMQGVLLFLAPAGMGMLAIAPVLIPELLGDKWEPSVVVIQITCLTFFAELPCFLLMGVFIGVGRSKEMARYGFILLIISAMSAAITAPFGVEAVAAGWAVRTFLLAGIALFAMNDIFPLQRAKFLRAVTPPILASIAMAATVIWASTMTTDLGRMTQLLILIPLGGVSYIAFLGLGDVALLWRGFTRETLGNVKRLVARG